MLTVLLEKLNEDRFYINVHKGLQYSELERLPYYEFVDEKKRLAQYLKDKEEAHKAAEKEQERKRQRSQTSSAPKYAPPKYRLPKR